jgi:2-iminoacetate synthase ThiH
MPVPVSLDHALDHVREGRTPDAAQAGALLDTPAERLSALLEAAATLRDRGRGRRITFSAKVFVPLTTLCRDYCGYCTFRRDPNEPGAFTMTPDEVVALAKAGERLGAKEALFSLGDKPEARFPEYRELLGRLGHRTTLSYLRAVSELTLANTTLLPHLNPGLMSERDLASLREAAPDDRPRRQARNSLHHRHPDRDRRVARRTRLGPARHSRAARTLRSHPGSHHPELQGEAVDPDEPLARARRRGSSPHRRGSAAAPRTRREHPGASEPVRGGIRTAAGGGAQ